MAFELSTDQARYIARMRAAWPDADVRVHQRTWGVIVEVRRSARTIALVEIAGQVRLTAVDLMRAAELVAADGAPDPEGHPTEELLLAA